MTNWSREKINSIKLNFIFCMERTGSSMFTAMLNKNESILSASEEPFALYLYKKYYNKKHYTKSEIDGLVEEFWQTSERNLKLYFDTKENLKENLYRFLPNLDFQFLCKILYLNFIPLKSKENVEVIVDKQMKFMYYFDLIREIFPNSKILFLVRDPKGVVTSWRKRKWGLNQTAAYLATLYHFNYSYAKKALSSNAQNVALLRYEDLVSNPEQELKRVCEFYEIPFYDKMVEHHTVYNAYIEKMEGVVPKNGIQHIRNMQSNTLKPVTTDLIDEWRTALTEDEIATVDKINKSLNEYFNYQSFIRDYKFTFSNQKNRLIGTIEKKYYHLPYINSPLGLKVFIKKIKYGLFKARRRWEGRKEK